MADSPIQAAHEAIAAVECRDEAQQLIAAKCRAMIVGYSARWAESEYEIADVEYLSTSDLWNPATNRKSRSFTVAGKIDARFTLKDRLLVVDHKTTSDDIADPLSPYWRQLVVEAQATHYILLEWLNGRKVDGAIWDVMRKPGIRPSKITAAELKSVTFTRKYCGFDISEESVGFAQSQGRESLEMYEARLIEDCTTIRPQWYFQRRQVPRLDAEVHEHAIELWEHGQEILHARNEKRWARNSGACMLYNSPCKFLGICSGHDSADSDKWKPKEQVHQELIGLLDGDGREVLTNSRIKSFQTCRRKHYFEYELGIQRVEEEEREALWFGTLWHFSLEAWFGWFKNERETHGNINIGSPANAVGAASSISY